MSQTHGPTVGVYMKHTVSDGKNFVNDDSELIIIDRP